MPRAVRGLALFALLMSAGICVAGEKARISSIKEGTYSSRQEGALLRDGSRWRIDVLHPSESATLTSIVGTEGGELLAINEARKTWYRLKNRYWLAIDRSLFTYGASPIEVSRLKLDRLPPASGSREVTFKLSYNIRFRISGEAVRGRVAAEIRVVTGPGCSAAAGSWSPLELNVGLPEVDDALRKAFGSIEGVPVETVTRVERQLEQGEVLHATITRRIEDCAQEPISPEVFAVPAGYRYEEPQLGIPGSN